MGRTLNLCECLLAMGRDWQAGGRFVEASRVLQRLASFHGLPVAIAEETHARLATIFLQLREFKKARRHLTSALFYRPSNATYYYQFASALHHDPDADGSRAARYYRQAVDLDPDQPRWWCDFGRLLFQLGRAQKGVVALRKAVTLAPDDPVILARLVDGLCLTNRTAEARAALEAARFRNPRDSRFRKLWSDFQFRQAAEEQYTPPVAEEPVILPFVRRAALPDTPKVSGRIIRLDTGSKSAPHLPRPAWRPDSKHAP